MHEKANSPQEPLERNLLLGGLKGNLANSFCVMQTGLEALHSYLAQNADPSVQQQAESLLRGISDRMAQTERFSANIADALLGRCGELHPLSRPMAVTTEVNRACHFVQREIETRGWQGSVEWHNKLDEPFFALADPTFVDSIFANLFSNALRFSGSRPEIHVRASRTGSAVCISVADNGPGIPDSVLRAVLSSPPEFLFDSQPSPVNLGLALTASYCHALGWKLQISSGKSGSVITLGMTELSPREYDFAAGSGQMPEALCAARQAARFRTEFDGVFGPAHLSEAQA